nr:hypothetical protein [Tanacetum cinerariifolium]
GKGSGIPTKPHHTPFPEVESSHPSTSSVPLPSIPTAPIPTVTVGNKMHKAFPLPGESSYWQYKFPLPVEGVPTARRMEIPLPGVCTAMMKKRSVKD